MFSASHAARRDGPSRHLAFEAAFDRVEVGKAAQLATFLLLAVLGAMFYFSLGGSVKLALAWVLALGYARELLRRWERWTGKGILVRSAPLLELIPSEMCALGSTHEQACLGECLAKKCP